MAKWRSSTWGDEISLEYGKGIRGYSEIAGPYRVYGSNGPIGWTLKPLAPGPGVILGRKGAYRGVRFSSEPFYVIDTAYYVVPKTNLDMRWLYYAIIYHKLGEIDDGSPIPSTTRSAVYVRELDVPPIEEQRSIASVLGALDDKIDRNRCMNETLEEMARAIFKDWFVEFGPTRAKMEGRAPYLAPEIWTLFPDRLDEEEKPERWEMGTLASYAKLNPESWSRSNYPSRVEYVDLSGTKWGIIESIETYDQERAPSRAQRVLRFGDTIVGMVRPGNGSYALLGTDGLTGSTGFVVLRPKRSDTREFTYLAATAPENIDRLAHLADGAAYPSVHPEIVLATEAVVVEQRLVEAFSATTGSLFDRMKANLDENHLLAAIRDLLLPKLVTGEISVKTASNLVEAVA